MQKKYLILGLALSGKAAIELLLKQKKSVIVFDDNYIDEKNLDDEIKKQKIKILSNRNFIDSDFINQDFFDFKEIEKIVISPGFNPNHEIVKQAKKNNIEIISEIELALRYIKKSKILKNKIIAITGTNGKTTLSKLLVHVLNKNSIKAHALGNIKVALSSYLMELNPQDVIVLELSSFQLENIKTKLFDIAVITNITPDHLDRYKNFQDYANQKLNIIKCLRKDKILYTTKKVVKSFIVKNNKINIKEVKGDIEDIAQKICLNFKIEKQNFLSALKTFKRVEHRLEFVREINDISFYNDSKATNVASVIYAVKKIKSPIILIAGGVDKGFSYKIWRKAFIGKVKCILAIGKSAKKIKNELTGFDVLIKKDLESAVLKAFELAKKDDSILLSPGCSSFDMFKNFEHRGEIFKKIVSLLGEK